MSIVTADITAVICFLFIYLMSWAVFLLPGTYLFLLTFPMEWIMKKLMPKVEEDSIEAKKWYYE